MTDAVPPASFTLRQMQALTRQWEAAADARNVFLRCYALMTGNMLAGISQDDFHDARWVGALVDRFAGYYFDALDAYDRESLMTPAVWRIAHTACQAEDTWTLQKLLLGINAHINYDLVLTLDEMLGPEWPDMPAAQRRARRADYDTVNLIIARTIDAVQDDVLEPAVPLLDWLDRLLGPADERLLSALLTHWRDEVWDHAVRLIEAPDPAARVTIVGRVEAGALRRAEAITLRDWTALADLA